MKLETGHAFFLSINDKKKSNFLFAIICRLMLQIIFDKLEILSCYLIIDWNVRTSLPPPLIPPHTFWRKRRLERYQHSSSPLARHINRILYNEYYRYRLMCLFRSNFIDCVKLKTHFTKNDFFFIQDWIRYRNIVKLILLVFFFS